MLRQTLHDPLLAAARTRLARLWPSMIAVAFLVWILTAAVLVPLTSAIIGWQMQRLDNLVVGNEELLRWLVTPGGFLYLSFAGGVALLNWMLRYAAYFLLVTEDREGRRISIATIVHDVLVRVPVLFRFALKSVALGAAFALPVLGGLALLYRGLLSGADINYYLTAWPREWQVALGLAALWLVTGVCVGLYLLSRLILALPSWVDGYKGFFPALRRSWTLTRHRSGRLLRVVLLLALLWLGVRAAADALILGLAASLLPELEARIDALWPLLMATGAFIGAAASIDVAIDFVGFAMLSIVVTKFYYEDTSLHQEAPPPVQPPAVAVAFERLLQPWLAPRRLLPVLAAVLLASLGMGYVLLQQVPDVGSPSITAHRAGPPPAPENSLAALERAIAAGADFAEIDVQRTRDGVLVVAHDSDLRRLAHDPRRIAQTDFASLQDLLLLPDDGSPPAERRLATLAEFLERAAGRIRLNIELKDYGDAGLAAAVVAELRRQPELPDVILMSLHLPTVRRLRELAPELSVGYVSSIAVGSVLELPVDFLALNHRRTTADTVRRAQQQGRAVHVWTVNGVAQMVDCIEKGVDNIITDDPALALRVRRQMQELSAPERLLLRFRTLLLPTADPADARLDDATGETTLITP